MKNLTITLALLASALFASCSDPDFTCHYDDIVSVESFADNHGRIYAYDMAYKTDNNTTKYVSLSERAYTLLSDTINNPLKDQPLYFSSRHGEYYVRIDHTTHTKIVLNK